MFSDEIAISVDNLSKCYQIYDAPQDRLKQFAIPRLQKILGLQPKLFYREFWALKNVSFEIKKGETVGIIGRNGSGKSTLLQIICGTLAATEGRIDAHGRIAALLELGSGFNPEFSGRENVYLNAAVMGLRQKEIDQRFDEIVAFADIGQFIDQPVKIYSSGMMIRLAFAVAINVDPEILIVDEALSVGDELFQRKCFSRIEAIKKTGATVLFVSHSGSTIIELCDRAILVDSGEKLASGPPKVIIGYYQKLLYAPEDKTLEIRAQIRHGESDREKIVPGFFEVNGQRIEKTHELHESFDPELIPSSTIVYESHGAYIQEPVVLTLAGEQVNNLIQGNEYIYSYMVKFDKSANGVKFAMLIKSTTGVEIGGAVTAVSPDTKIQFVEKGAIYKIEFRFKCILNSGVYFLNAGITGDIQGTEGYLHRVIDSAMFRVIPISSSHTTAMVDFGCYPTIRRVQK